MVWNSLSLKSDIQYDNKETLSPFERNELRAQENSQVAEDRHHIDLCTVFCNENFRAPTGRMGRGA